MVAGWQTTAFSMDCHTRVIHESTRLYNDANGDMFCGDLIRVGGTIVIPADKGGSVPSISDSLHRVRGTVATAPSSGDGVIVDDPIALIDEYIAPSREHEGEKFSPRFVLAPRNALREC